MILLAVNIRYLIFPLDEYLLLKSKCKEKLTVTTKAVDLGYLLHPMAELFPPPPECHLPPYTHSNSKFRLRNKAVPVPTAEDFLLHTLVLPEQ